jgi:hypothetical protein
MFDGSLEMDRPTNPKPEPKEAYSTPELTIYGTIEELTKSLGAHGSADGGSFPKDRTHV